MAALTLEQVHRLAGNFLSLAQAVGDYRQHHWNNLSKEQNQLLGNYQWSILNYAEDFLSNSTILLMNESQQSLSRINNLSDEIREMIKNQQHVQIAIDTAETLVSLGAAIMSKNPPAIAQALSRVIDVWGPGPVLIASFDFN